LTGDISRIKITVVAVPLQDSGGHDSATHRERQQLSQVAKISDVPFSGSFSAYSPALSVLCKPATIWSYAATAF
jgi:hypothetical protein